MIRGLLIVYLSDNCCQKIWSHNNHTTQGQQVQYIMLDTFPSSNFPRVFSQVATSQVCPSRSARPSIAAFSASEDLSFGKLPFGKLPLGKYLAPSTLQYTTVYDSTLQYTAVHYSILQYTTVHYSILKYTAVHYSILQYTTVY